MNEGTGLTLECAVEDGIGTVTFQWQREGDVGEGREDINRRDIITFTANSSLLLFDKVASDDNRLYFCVARDFLSEMTKVFNVSVKGERIRQAYYVSQLLTLFVWSKWP